MPEYPREGVVCKHSAGDPRQKGGSERPYQWRAPRWPDHGFPRLSGLKERWPMVSSFEIDSLFRGVQSSMSSKPSIVMCRLGKKYGATEAMFRMPQLKSPSWRAREKRKALCAIKVAWLCWLYAIRYASPLITGTPTVHCLC